MTKQSNCCSQQGKCPMRLSVRRRLQYGLYILDDTHHNYESLYLKNYIMPYFVAVITRTLLGQFQGIIFRIMHTAGQSLACKTIGL